LILLKNGAIQDNQRGIYIYGFELFWSTLLCIASILSLGALFEHLNLAVIFLLFFILFVWLLVDTMLSHMKHALC